MSENFEPVDFDAEGWGVSTTSNTVSLNKEPSLDLVAKIVELEGVITKLTVERQKYEVVALIILGVLAVAGLGLSGWLLAVGVAIESVAVIMGVSNLAAGAIAGAMTFSKRG
jgi:hypothetical protein